MNVRLGFVLLPQFAMGALAAFTDLLGLLEAGAGPSVGPDMGTGPDAGTRSGSGTGASAGAGLGTGSSMSTEVGSGASDPGSCAWEIVADTLIPVRSASGVQVVPTDLLGDPQRFDLIVVVGGPLPAPEHYPRELLAWLHRSADGDRSLVALCNGVFALAQAGVLAGHRLCVATDHYRDFTRRFPAISPEHLVVDRPAVFDRRRVTCAGGAAVTDVAVRLLCRSLPQPDVQRALRRLQVDPSGPDHQLQPPPAGLPPDSPPAVQRAVALIEQYAGHALSLPQLAERVGLSPRQLQRLFARHLQLTPQAYARQVRLESAAWMLSHTRKSIATIASDCGFSDAAHMGRLFQAAHGMPPGRWRRQAGSAENTV